MANKHNFEDNPPHAERYVNGDDNWQLATNACPVGSEKINDLPGNAGVLESVQKVMRPVMDDLDSAQCYDSTTKG